jgi:O-methyltransferase involved in polyketide biosynthesis
MAEDSRQAAPKLDSAVPHSARTWNYWLGGKDNFAVDREVGDQLKAVNPQIVRIAQEDRGFLIRAVTYLAGEAGIRQFLDIGTGLPTANNTHEVAQRVAPESKIVYVDNDPLVLVHARALLTSSPQGVTDYVDADLHGPEKILQEAAQTLDFSKPVAVMLLGVVLFVLDDDEARSIVRTVMDACPSGSYLALTHGTALIEREAMEEHTRTWNEHGTPKLTMRTPEQIEGFFEGLELLEPGVVSCPRWRPEGGVPQAADVDVFGGVGRKP